MAAVALYTMDGTEDDTPEHPNAFFLPRLDRPSITLAQLHDCFPLADRGEFQFSFKEENGKSWRVMAYDDDEAPLDVNKRLFLRIVQIRDWEAEATEAAQEAAEAAQPSTPHAATSPGGSGAQSEDLPSLQELHAPSPSPAPAETPGPAHPSPVPASPAEEEQSPGEKAVSKVKDEGNAAFKNGQFPVAIETYTKAVGMLAKLPSTKATDTLLCACLGNRAACRIQERDFEMGIEDCDLVLEKQPKNAKALVRRGTCYEHIEKHKKALADFEAALALDMKNKNAQQSAVRLRKLIKTLY
eukprot:TRINITY_DN20128_c0_g1_i1.p1 TRINITY_DN20128_c0_g1~~TRINITY_DN20128_c0_g1_i1.p1  ORF type:complete len:299 (+),score=83.14 TRINITY_DN20128_c0_g1_i1:56-952(+)